MGGAVKIKLRVKGEGQGVQVTKILNGYSLVVKALSLRKFLIKFRNVG